MRTGKRSRPASVLAAAALAVVAGVGSGALVAPAPVQADKTVRGYQWYLDTLKIPQAHKITKGRGVTVAVVDSGVDANVPDLRGQVLPGKGISASSAGDGRRDDDQEKAHGTSMAGLVAGKGGGPMRHLGIAPEAKILPVALRNPFRPSEIAAGIRWATDNGADVINLSLGSDETATAEETAAVRYALDRDVVVVAAAGNRLEGDRIVGSPANIPGVIAVTGLAKDGGFFAESVSGPEAVLAAPMEKIISPRPTSVSPNGYGLGSGTSEASAITSGVVALVRAKYPDLDAANVAHRVIRTARDRGPAGRDSQYGFGVVDPLAALTRQVPQVTSHPLLVGAAAATTAPSSAAKAEEDDGPAVAISMKKGPGALVAAAFCLAIPVFLVVLVVVLVRRSRRRPASAPAGVPGRPPAGGVQFGPPGFPPPGGGPAAAPVPPQAGPPGGPYGPPSAPQAGPAAGHGPVPGGPYAPPPAPRPGGWPPPGAAPYGNPPPPPVPGGPQQ